MKAARFTRGSMVLDVLADGRVLVTLPPATVPFGAGIAATMLYPSLRAFIAGVVAGVVTPASVSTVVTL